MLALYILLGKPQIAHISDVFSKSKKMCERRSPYILWKKYIYTWRYSVDDNGKFKLTMRHEKLVLRFCHKNLVNFCVTIKRKNNCIKFNYNFFINCCILYRSCIEDLNRIEIH